MQQTGALLSPPKTDERSDQEEFRFSTAKKDASAPGIVKPSKGENRLS